MSQPAKPSVSQTTILGLTPSQIVSLVGVIAGAALPGASIAGLSIAQVTNLGIGVANGVDEAIEAVEEIKGVAAAGGVVTPEQWANWNAAADLVNDQVNAAADRVINGQKAPGT